MAKFTLSPDDLERVAHDRYHHPCPQIQKRMEVLWLASHAKLTQEAVAELAGVGLASVQRFLATYRREGLDAVQRRNYVGPASGSNLTPAHWKSTSGFIRAVPILM